MPRPPLRQRIYRQAGNRTGAVDDHAIPVGMPVPSPVVLGQVSERFRRAVKTQAEREDIPVYQLQHKERKDDIANNFRKQREVRDGIRHVR